MEPVVMTIDDPKAPERLIGRKVTATVDEVNKKLQYAIDMPDDPTPNEIGYVKLAIGEIVDRLRDKFPFIGFGQTCRMEE